MSETPKERIEKWLAEVTGWGQEVVGQFAPAEVRDAIRAGMAQLRQAEVLGDQAEQELEQAEAERDALMDDVQSTGKLWHEAESRAEKAEVALRTLLDKLERVEASEAYRSVWIVAQIHAGPYHGENWAVERAAARAALRDTAPAHLSTEAEALAVMGAGQKLTKLREIEKP